LAWAPITGGVALGRLALGTRRLAAWGGVAQALGFGLVPVPWPFFALGLAPGRS
jgi:hypothetical protein